MSLWTARERLIIFPASWPTVEHVQVYVLRGCITQDVISPQNSSRTKAHRQRNMQDRIIAKTYPDIYSNYTLSDIETSHIRPPALYTRYVVVHYQYLAFLS